MKIAILMGLLLLMLHQIAPGLAIPLSVKNNVSGIDRTNVPVQMGVPFPEGKLKASDVSKLTISDSITGAAIPAGIKATVFWHDGSVRWIRILFPATTSGSTKSTYMLTDANKNPDGGLQAEQGNNTVTVNTGPLKFIVKGTNFNLIDQAWINESTPGLFNDNNRIVTSGNSGGFFLKIANTVYSSNTTNAVATLYEKSGYHAIVKVEGKLNQFAYTLFLYAYADKPYIKMVHRFFYDTAYGWSGSLKNIKDISLVLKTNVSGGNAAVSTLEGEIGSVLKSDSTDTLILNYRTPDSYSVVKGTDTLTTGIGMNGTGASGPINMGWGHLSNDAMGIGGVVRFMWQMAPKNISILGSGNMELHLYSPKAMAMPFYGGGGRTHFAGLSFSKNKAVTQEMFYAVTQPLNALAPAKWLSAQTKVLGKLVPCEAATFETSLPSMISQFKNMGTIHGHADRKKVIDNEHSYGFLSFGDLSDPPNSCSGRHWSNNYYDFPHCIAQGFLITAGEANLETGLAHALHMMDMDHSSVTGQSRSGPGWGNWGDYNLCDIAYSTTANHYKCSGIFDWANILAEPILGETGLRIAKWATGYPSGQARAIGHVLEALSSAYAYTNDPTWKTYLEGAFTKFNLQSGSSTLTSGDGGPFQMAYIGEGLTWALLEIPSSSQAKGALQYFADYWAKHYDMSSSDPFDHSFGDFPDIVSGFFPSLSAALDLFPANDTLYKRVLGDMWSVYTSPTGQGNVGDGRLKTFTQKFRGSPHYFHHVLKTGYDPMTPDYFSATTSVVAVEKKRSALLPEGSLSIYPNPFLAATRISYAIPEGITTLFVSLSIYNASGQQVAHLTQGSNGTGAYSVIWNGKNNFGDNVPSGVYMLVLKTGHQSLYKKLMLIR